MRGGCARSVLLFSLAAFFCSAVKAQESERPRREPDPKEQLQRLRDSKSRGVKGQEEYERELAEVAERFGLDREPPTPPLDQGFDEIDRLPSSRTPPRQPGLRQRAEQDQRFTSHRSITLEDLESNLSARYRLSDVSGHVLFWGDDKTALAEKLNTLLSTAGEHSFCIEMLGFTEDKAEALTTSLRIQQHQIDPSVSISVLPHFAENPSVRDNLFTRGIRLERMSSPESIVSGKDAGSFRAIAEFTVRIGNNVRAVTIWILSATEDFITEFRELVHLRFPTYAFNEHQSLSELIHGVRAELKAKHGLTDQQFRTSIVGQFGKIDISLLDERVPSAWS